MDDRGDYSNTTRTANAIPPLTAGDCMHLAWGPVVEGSKLGIMKGVPPGSNPDSLRCTRFNLGGDSSLVFLYGLASSLHTTMRI